MSPAKWGREKFFFHFIINVLYTVGGLNDGSVNLFQITSIKPMDCTFLREEVAVMEGLQKFFLDMPR